MIGLQPVHSISTAHEPLPFLVPVRTLPPQKKKWRALSPSRTFFCTIFFFHLFCRSSRPISAPPDPPDPPDRKSAWLLFPLAQAYFLFFVICLFVATKLTLVVSLSSLLDYAHVGGPVRLHSRRKDHPEEGPDGGDHARRRPRSRPRRGGGSHWSTVPDQATAHKARLCLLFLFKIPHHASGPTRGHQHCGKTKGQSRALDLADHYPLGQDWPDSERRLRQMLSQVRAIVSHHCATRSSFTLGYRPFLICACGQCYRICDHLGKGYLLLYRPWRAWQQGPVPV